jgi:aspartate racemase
MQPARTIGIVGGTSPESTIHYYQYIVRRHQQEYGDHSYPRIVIASVSFQPYIDWQHAGQWDRVAAGLEGECRAVAAAGADFALLAANTMHKVLPQIDSPIPMLSILDAVADAARAGGYGRLGLTGTRFVMSDGFYAQGLEERGIGVTLPDAAQQNAIHAIIYAELIAGIVSENAVSRFGEICADLIARGAEAILLACTELELLTRGRNLPYTALDSAAIHAEAAWRAAIDGTHKLGPSMQ